MVLFRRAIHILHSSFSSSSSSPSSSLPLQISIGILAASYWRGSWYVLDHILYPNERLKSGIASILSGGTLLAWQQYLLSPSHNGTKQFVRLLPPPPLTSIVWRRKYIQANRFVLLYGIATSCVLLWRGTWLLWDEAAHSIADCIDDYSAGGVGSTGRGEDSTAANSQEATIATITTTTAAATTTDTPAPVCAMQQSRHSTSTNSTLVGGNITSASSSMSSSCIVKEQCQNNQQQQQQKLPPPGDADDHHHHSGQRQHPPAQPQHPQHEDHHGESSVTQHPDITDRTLFYSGIASHIVATVVLLFMGRFVSVMAPPANITLLRDHFIHERGKGFAKAAKKFFSNPQ